MEQARDPFRGTHLRVVLGVVVVFQKCRDGHVRAVL